MRQHSGGKLHREEHHIFNLALEIALAVRGDADRRFTEQVQCHGHVVRAEAPQGVLVRANLAQIHAQTVEVVDPTELPPLHQGAQPLDCGVEQQQVTGQDRNPALRGRASHCLRIARAQGKRLLDQARLPRLDTLQRQARVRGRRRGDDHRLRPADQVGGIGGDVHARILATQLLSPLGVRVAHRGEFAVGEARRRAHVVPPPRAGPDDAELEPGHP